MALLFIDGVGYTDFGRSDYKYLWAHYPFEFGTPYYGARSNFWDPSIGSGPGWSSGTRSGLIDSGPYPGTYSLHMQSADPIWYESAYMGVGGSTTSTDFIVGMWLYPINIVGSKTFLVFLGNFAPPNLGQYFVIQARSDGKIVFSPSPGPNLNNNAGQFGVLSTFAHWPFPSDGSAPGVSVANIPINSGPPTPGSARGWTHMCMQIHFNRGDGFVKLWINGCLDIQGSGLDLAPGSNLITPCWASQDGSELCVSQFVIQDTSGSQNNSNVSPFAAIQTVFPTSDVLNNWSGGGYSQVNGNPGPNSSFVSLPSLASPDELFGFPALAASPQVLGVACNMALLAPTQQVAGIFQVPSKATVPITPNIAPPGAPPGWPSEGVGTTWTRQAISEINPWTGAPWTIADISAAAWGVRGIAGISEQVYQYFLEVLWQTGPAQCGGGSYLYGQ